MSRSVSFRFDCRLAGLFYLAMGVTGGLGFMLIRPELFASGDPAQTLSNLIAQPGLARLGIAFEMGTALFQALAAVWFARLFRDTDAFAANALAHFGMVNAIVVLASGAMLGAAFDAAHASVGAEPTISHLLTMISARFWQVGNVFFGLWLIPMGWLANRARFGPRALGWILIVGGVGYVLNAILPVLVPAAPAWMGTLAIPATVGEFWMIGLLLWTGFRRPTLQTTAEPR